VVPLDTNYGTEFIPQTFQLLLPLRHSFRLSPPTLCG
jgi:hypothetical protein